MKYWTGHAKSSDGEVVRQTITDRYIKMAKDTKFRADVTLRSESDSVLNCGRLKRWKLFQVFQGLKKRR